MVKFRQIGILLVSCVLHLKVQAADNLYAAFSLGYSDIEFSQQEGDGVGYKLTLGYQFDPQWYIETGYQQLVDDSLFISSLPNAADVNSGESKQQGDALFVALLGKASGRMGELFYRLGVLKTDIRGQEVLAGSSSCSLGQATQISVANFGTATLCDYDESGVAGVFGLGFDYFISARAMVRTEIEYIKGQDDLTVSAAFVGLRYNF